MKIWISWVTSRKSGVKLALHGDVHTMLRERIGHRHSQELHVVGAGSFAARASDRGESVPRLYDVIEIGRDLKSFTVHTREQRTPDGAWKGWYEWDDPEGGDGHLPKYKVEL